MRSLLRRLRARIRYRRFDADLAVEMEFHHAMKQRELERAGLTENEATVQSRREMGSVTLARERSREIWICKAGARSGDGISTQQRITLV